MHEEFNCHPALCQNDQLSLSDEKLVSPEVDPLIEEADDMDSKPQSSHLKLADAKEAPKTSKPSLRLVKPAAISAPVYTSMRSLKHYFTAEVRARSPYDFIMVAQDLFHYLHCELPLQFKANEEGKQTSLTLVSNFPTICNEDLVDFIDENEDLLGMILIQFHMHILQNLFLFCHHQGVQSLILEVTEKQFKELGIYREFIRSVEKNSTDEGIRLEITIPFYDSSLMTCSEFMDYIAAKFRKTLWKEQKASPAIRDYLKTNVRLSIVP